MKTINIGGKLLSTEQPLVMGILNITKDSFYDGGEYDTISRAVSRVGQMLEEGCDIVDIGAFSSRPGAELTTAEDQLTLLKPVFQEIKIQYPELPISIDTFSADVVQGLVPISPFLVNDISGGAWDKDLQKVVASESLPYVLMHTIGTPDKMSKNANYEDVCAAVLKYFANKINTLTRLGVNDIILDPGFGFAKTLDHNFQLLDKLNVFNIFDRALMVGLSRKSMIYKSLKTNAKEALNGTTALNMAALMNGARILRVHDVKEAVETRTLWSKLQSLS